MKYLYEFIGTFFLVATVGMVVIGPGAAAIGFAPLAIGTVTLEDGSQVKGFVAEPRALEGAEDITVLGGWRAFIARVLASGCASRICSAP